MTTSMKATISKKIENGLINRKCSLGASEKIACARWQRCIEAHEAPERAQEALYLYRLARENSPVLLLMNLCSIIIGILSSR